VFVLTANSIEYFPG